MKAPDVIVVLSGGIKQDTSGRWVSTDLTAEDHMLCAPGGKLRVLAAAVLAAQYPEARIVSSGGMGYDVAKNAPEGHPVIAEVMRDELLECGVPEDRIILERESETTFQQLRQLEILARESRWKHFFVTSRYHLARLRAMLDAKFPTLGTLAELVSAEDVLIESDRARWEAFLAEAYASAFMAERIAQEERGVLQIRNGTYQFR